MNENNNREEKGFEAYIEREFIENTEEFELPKERKKSFRIAFTYALVFVLVLIVIGITGTYAYYDVTTSNTSQTSSINSSTACFDVQLSETSAFELQYKYPITDTFATSGSNITPLTVTVHNKCTTGEAIPYKLYLTTYPDGGTNGHMDNTRVSMQVTKASAPLEGFDKVTIQSKTGDSNVPDTLKNAIGAKSDATDLKDGKYILVSSGSVASSVTDTYSFKFWINYGSNSETNVSGDFKALVSAIIN